jgi:hypothetical protein
MAEVVALLVLGASIGAITSFAFTWDRAFQAGASWASRNDIRWPSHD